MFIKKMLYRTIIFNSIIVLGLVGEKITTNPSNRILNKGWYNGINGKHFTGVFYNYRRERESNISNMPVVIKNRKGKLKLAGTLGKYRAQKPDAKPIDFSPKAKKLFDAITNDYGVICDDRFLIVYSDEVSDCEKVLTQFRNELKDAEEGLVFLENKQKQLTEFLTFTMNDDNTENDPNAEKTQ